MKEPAIFSLLSFIVFFTFITGANCQQPVALEEGIRQYQRENYEEAIETLEKVRKQFPSFSQAAFFLGMAYKQVMDFPKATVNLQDAVTLSPPVKDALVELIDALYQTNNLEKAKTWLEKAEKEGVYPARVSFLKGMILAKENNHQGAIAAFEKAKQLDSGLTQAAEFQVGMSYMKDRKLGKAKERFQAVIQRDRLSDLAAFARQYQSVLEQIMRLERPLRLTVGIMAGYDTNIVSKPTESSVAGDITGEEGAVLSSSARLDYVPKLDGPWLFSAQLAVASNVNSKHTHSHDSLANTISLSPGYNFGRFALNLTASYTNVLLRTDPDLVPSIDSTPGYKRYLDYVTYGPTLRIMVNQNNILEIFGGYDQKEYFNQKIPTPESNRDSEGLRTYISWIWLFKENAFFNLRYDYNKENADGIYWDNKGNKFTANLSVPLLPQDLAKRSGQLNLQLTGSAYLQKYGYDQPYVDSAGNSGVIERDDKIYTGSLGVAWTFSQYASFIAQYTRTRSDSNIPANTYDKDLYMSGFEFRF